MTDEETDEFQKGLRKIIYTKLKETKNSFEEVYMLVSIEFLTLLSLFPPKERQEEKNIMIKLIGEMPNDKFEDWDDFKETVLGNHRNLDDKDN